MLYTLMLAILLIRMRIKLGYLVIFLILYVVLWLEDETLLCHLLGATTCLYFFLLVGLEYLI